MILFFWTQILKNNVISLATLLTTLTSILLNVIFLAIAVTTATWIPLIYLATAVTISTCVPLNIIFLTIVHHEKTIVACYQVTSGQLQLSIQPSFVPQGVMCLYISVLPIHVTQQGHTAVESMTQWATGPWSSKMGC
jgi:hypothetical protein